MNGPAPPRLLPQIELPAARYIPGCTPEVARPERPDWQDQLDPRHWHDCRAYLYGLDLFNHGYYWEAHEVWEGLWQQAGRAGPLADFLKALIKLAAAGVKHCQGNEAGRRSNAQRAAVLFGTLPGPVCLGLALADVAQLAAQCARGWSEQPVLMPRR